MAAGRRPDRRRWLAISSIIGDLHTTAASAQWVNSIYSLVFAALLATLGRLGDMYGRRRLFRLGAVWFVLASLVAATAPTSGVLILGRILQGIGGAMIPLTTDLSWRWAFLINFPLGAAILGGLVRMVPETSDPRGPRGLTSPGSWPWSSGWRRSGSGSSRVRRTGGGPPTALAGSDGRRAWSRRWRRPSSWRPWP